jgi:hypothetical protein
MPSKGKPQVGTRLSHELYAEMLETIALQNEWKEGEPWTIASWVEHAISEKVAKARRGRGIKGAGATRFPLRSEEFQ